MKKTLFLTLLLFFACDGGDLLPRAPQNGGEAKKCLPEQRHFLGRGINLGNWLEAPRWSLQYGQASSWGVKIETRDFENIAERGFENIRIPARFSDYLTQDGRVSSDFMQKLRWAVNQTVDRGMIAIIDVHHFEQMNNNPQAYFATLKKIWEDIALEFADYDNSKVFFELLNEPHGALTPELWNQYSAALINQIRESNPCRPILLGTADWGGFSALSALNIPDDGNLIITLHYYNPMQFTHQGADWTPGGLTWLGTRWTGTVPEKLSVKNDFEQVAEFARQRNLRIHIGEFGAYNPAQYEDRVLWTRYIAELCNHFGFAHSYWEYSAGFGAFNPQTRQWREELTDALFSTEAVTDTDYRLAQTNIIRNPNFEYGLSGWTFGVWHASGEADASANADGMNVRVTKVAVEPWGIQLLQDNLPLVAGKTYLLSFDLAGDEGMAVSVNVETYGDWIRFGATSAKASAKNVKAVIMAQESANPVRLIFNFALSEGLAVISNVSLREIIY